MLHFTIMLLWLSTTGRWVVLHGVQSIEYVFLYFFGFVTGSCMRKIQVIVCLCRLIMRCDNLLSRNTDWN